MCARLSVAELPPKDPKLDRDLLVAMGMSGLAQADVRTVSDLHGKLTEMRNMVAHFLLTKGESPPGPLHTSDGQSYQAFSSAAAVLLHYRVQAFSELSVFFQRHLSAKVLVGSVLPMVAQREKYRMVVRSDQESRPQKQ